MPSEFIAISRVLSAVMMCAFCVSVAGGAVTATGDVDPADPTSWNLDTIGVPLPIILS